MLLLSPTRPSGLEVFSLGACLCALIFVLALAVHSAFETRAEALALGKWGTPLPETRQATPR